MSTSGQDRDPDIELFVKVRQTELWLQYFVKFNVRYRRYMSRIVSVAPLCVAESLCNSIAEVELQWHGHAALGVDPGLL